METKADLLQIVIPSSGRERSLGILLNSLLAQQLSPQPRILVVLNPPQASRSQKLQRQFPTVEFFESPAGANQARNRGWQACAPGPVYFLDDDTVLPRPDHLRRVLQRALTMAGNDICGGSYLTSPQGSLSVQVYNEIQRVWFLSGDQGAGHWLHLFGGNLLLKKMGHAHTETLFDEKLRFGGTESEFLRRRHLAGDRLHADLNLSVEHHPELHVVDLLEKTFQQGVGKWHSQNKLNWQSPWATRRPHLKGWKASFLLNLAEWSFHQGEAWAKREQRSSLSPQEIRRKVLLCLPLWIFQTLKHRWRLFCRSLFFEAQDHIR